MADPRLTLDYQGQNAEYLTFLIDASTITFAAGSAGGSASVGLAVTMGSADRTVKLTEDAEEVVGKLINVTHDGYCTVQVGGVMALPSGDGATITRGKQCVGDLGAASAKGYVRDVNTAVAAELGVARGFCLSATADSDGNVEYSF